MSALSLLITAGPTREHLDPVRFFSNGSSGRMGYALAEEAAARGCRVDLVTGPVALAPPAGVQVYSVVSADGMFRVCEPLFETCDWFLSVAAVSDFRPERRLTEKLKKSGEPLDLVLVPTIDILKTLAARKTRQRIVGFAAETERVEEFARKKLMEKQCDWMVANEVGRPGTGMDADDNSVVLLGSDGSRAAFGPAPKRKIAAFLLESLLGPR